MQSVIVKIKLLSFRMELGLCCCNVIILKPGINNFSNYNTFYCVITKYLKSYSISLLTVLNNEEKVIALLSLPNIFWHIIVNTLHYKYYFLKFYHKLTTTPHCTPPHETSSLPKAEILNLSLLPVSSLTNLLQYCRLHLHHPTPINRLNPQAAINPICLVLHWPTCTF